MKITVITVCFNSVDTIEKAIKSVIEQEHVDREYIIIDGGSTDGTLDIIRKYQKYITKWVSEPDKGLFDAMNKGIGMATGDVIAFLNSDDWYMKSALSIINSTFLQQNCDCVCCDNYVIQKDGSKIYYDASDLSVEDMYKRMIYFHSAIFARRELFKKCNNFDLSYKIAADYDWMLRVINEGARLFYLHKPVFTFCYGGISSVNEIECARETREIAIRHLPTDRKEYLRDIDDRYFEIAACASDKTWINENIRTIIDMDIPIILWGAGYWGKQCLTWLRKADIRVESLIDSNKDKWGECVEGVVVQSPTVLEGRTCNLIVTPANGKEEIHKQISLYRGDFSVYELKKLWRKMVELNEH